MAELSSRDLVGLISHDPAYLAILRSDGDGFRPQELLAASDQDALSSLAPVAITTNVVTHELNDALYQTIVLDTASAGRVRTQVALRAVAIAAALAPQNYRSALLKRCLDLSGVGISPYSEPGLEMEARIAAQRLLSAHSDIDNVALERLTAGKPPSEDLRAILAGTLVGRLERRPELFADVLIRWKPNGSDAELFASESDSRYSAADPVARLNEPKRNLPWRSFRTPVVLGITLLGASVGALMEWLIDAWPGNLGFGWGGAIGLIALVVAVNVVSAELSANRLAGSLARFTSLPASLVGAYSAALLIVASVGTTAALPKYRVGRYAQATLTAELPLFFVFMTVALLALVRRTDPATAAHALARVRRRTYIRGGARFGRIQRMSGSARDLIASVRGVALVPSLTRVERRLEVTAPISGFFLLSNDRVAQISLAPGWATGRVEAQFLSRLGTRVVAGEAVAALVPSTDAATKSRDLKDIRRAIAVDPGEDIEETSEACALLLSVLIEASSRGDDRGAARVEEALIGLLTDHVAAVRKERGTRRPHRDVAPFVPAFVTIIQGILGELSRANAAPLRSSLMRLLTRCLRLGEEGDQLALLTGGTILDRVARGEGREWLPSAMWETGARALEINDQSGFYFLRTVMEQRMVDHSGVLWPAAIDVASRWTVYSVWTDQALAPETWDWFWRVTDRTGSDARERLMGAMRVGAAALLAWNPSTAIRVVRDIGTSWAIDKLEDWVRDPAVGLVEHAASHQHGRYLGGDAEDAMAHFARFAEQIAPVMVAAPGSGTP